MYSTTRTVGGVTAFLVCLTSVVLAGDTASAPTDSALAQLHRRQRLDPKVIVTRRAGTDVSGLLDEMTADSLIIWSGTERSSVARTEIRSVEVRPRSERVGLIGLAEGMILGLYAGNMIAGHARGSPTLYYSSERVHPWFLINALFAGPGAFAGYGFRAGTNREREIIFPAGDVQSRRSWEELEGVLRSRRRHSMVHVGIQGGPVFLRVANQARDQFSAAGTALYYGGGSPNEDEEWDEPNDLDLLRRCDLTVRVTRRLDVGAAVVWMGEPVVWAAARRPQNIGMRQSFEATGYYPFATYTLLGHVPPEGGARVYVGGGIGPARVEYEAVVDTVNPVTQQTDVVSYGRSRTAFTAYGLLGAEIFSGRTLSLGVALDYAFGPTYDRPALGRLPAQRIPVGNGSIGLTCRVHL